MKTKKRYFFIGAVVLLGILIAGCGLFSSCGPPRFCERGFHHRFPGRGFSERILKRIDKKVEKLELSETQKQKYAEIRQKIEVDFKKMSAGREALFNEFKGEIKKENPDMNRIVGLLKDRLKDMPDHISRHLDYFVEFYSILTEDQKAQILEKVRDRIGTSES